MGVKHLFQTNRVELTDGSVLHEVVTPEGERIAAADNNEQARDLERALNLALTEWAENTQSATTSVD